MHASQLSLEMRVLVISYTILYDIFEGLEKIGALVFAFLGVS